MNSVLILCDQGPMGSNAAAEAVRLGVGLAALGDPVECKVVFTGDGVTAFLKTANPEAIGMEGMKEQLEMISLASLSIVLIREDMEARGITPEELFPIETLTIMGRAEVPSLIEKFDTVFSM